MSRYIKSKSWLKLKIIDKLFSYLSKATRMLFANFSAFNTNKGFEESAKSR